MDIADHAQAKEEAERDNLIRNIVFKGRVSNATKPDRAGSETCVDCEAVIPAARRASVPGVERCLDCQETKERQLNGRR